MGARKKQRDPMTNVDQVIQESVQQFQAMANRIVEETANAVREQLLQQIQSAAGTAAIPTAAPPKRKRGRPSKKEVAAREAVAVAVKAKSNGTNGNGTAPAEKKPRKKRKPLSPENKAKLAENLRKAREAKKARQADEAPEAQAE